MSPSPRSGPGPTTLARYAAAAAFGLSAALVLAACSNPSEGGSTEVGGGTKGSGTKINLSPGQKRVTKARISPVSWNYREDNLALEAEKGNGTYAEAVSTSGFNPPGLPTSGT